MGPAGSGRVAVLPPAVPPSAAAPSGASEDSAGAGLPAPNPKETPIAVLPPNLRRVFNSLPAPTAGTAEIPQATQAGVQAYGPNGQQPASSLPQNTQDYTNPQIAAYVRAQEGISDPTQMQSLQAALAQGAFSSPIGLELREATRTLATGEVADGLLILKVIQGSPAARAGLHGYDQTMHEALIGAAIAATMASFGATVIAVPLIANSEIGENYDLIIGVDGYRVTNILDFENRMRDVRGGELVYFSVVRNGYRKQITVKIPKDMANLAW